MEKNKGNQGVTQTGPKKTLLIVDDEEEFRRILGKDFTRQGMNVLMAGTGNGALEVLQENKVDVVLSDIRMGNGDGITLLRKVREKYGSLPIVLMMTGQSDITSEEVQKIGAKCLLRKPFQRSEVIQAVLEAASETPKRD